MEEVQVKEEWDQEDQEDQDQEEEIVLTARIRQNSSRGVDSLWSASSTGWRRIRYDQS